MRTRLGSSGKGVFKKKRTSLERSSGERGNSPAMLWAEWSRAAAAAAAAAVDEARPRPTDSPPPPPPPAPRREDDDDGTVELSPKCDTVCCWSCCCCCCCCWWWCDDACGWWGWWWWCCCSQGDDEILPPLNAHASPIATRHKTQKKHYIILMKIEVESHGSRRRSVSNPSQTTDSGINLSNKRQRSTDVSLSNLFFPLRPHNPFLFFSFLSVPIL